MTLSDTGLFREIISYTDQFYCPVLLSGQYGFCRNGTALGGDPTDVNAGCRSNTTYEY